MAGWLFNLAYGATLTVVSPYLLYQMICKGKYREGWKEKFLGLIPCRTEAQPCIWMHAVSVGEVNLLAPLVDQLVREYPHFDCVISTTTATGMAVARTKFPDLRVFYCPLDFTWATRRAIRRIRPTLIVLTELEIWPNLISAAKRSGASVAVINGRLSARSFRRYLLVHRFMHPVFRMIDCVCAQSPNYAERFITLGVARDRVVVTGSMKFDGVQTRRDNPESNHFRRLAGIQPGDVVFLAGSTQAPEEALALNTFRALRGRYPQLRLILVPRHPHRFGEVARLLDVAGTTWQRRTELDGRGADPQARVLLVDTVGELKAWWGLADIAYVGGSLGNRGGQNMIEPAAYGAALSFGPFTQNFKDVVELLLAADAARVVRNQQELTAFVQWCLQLPDVAQAMGERARQVVLQNQGATSRTLLKLRPFLMRSPWANRERSAA